MAHPFIATPALSDAATLTGGPVAGSMPLSNLQTQQPGTPTRWTDLTQVYVVIDLGAAYNLNEIAFLYTNGTSSATVRRRGATSIANLTSAPGYDSGVVSLWPTAGLSSAYTRFPSYAFSTAGFGTYRYWRIDVYDAGNPLEYFQAGRLFLASVDSGTMYIFPRGAAPGGTIGPRETPTRLETASGQLHPTVNIKRDYEKFTLAAASEEDVLKRLGTIKRLRGVSRAVLYCRDPENPYYVVEKSVYGLLTIDDAVYLGWEAGSFTENEVAVNGRITYQITGMIEEMP